MILAMLISLIPAAAVSASAAPAPVTIEENAQTVTIGDEEYTVVSSADQLKAGLAKENAKVILAGNIDLGAVTDGALVCANGTVLNGNGNTLTYTGAPAFGLNSGNVIVRNLNIGTEVAPAPGVAGNVAASVTWENVNVYSSGHTVENDSSLWIVQATSELSFLNCTVRGSGNFSSEGNGSAAGVFVGKMHFKVTLKNCISFASINSKAAYTGWIGVLDGEGEDRFITNCINFGDLSGGAEVGAFLGCNNGGWRSLCFQNAINFGNITATGHAGGLCGTCSDNGVSFERCLNAGQITANGGGEAFCGGIAASGRYFTANECANVGELVNQGYTGNVFGYAPNNIAAPEIKNCYAFAQPKNYKNNNYTGIFVASWYPADKFAEKAADNKYIPQYFAGQAYHQGAVTENGTVTVDEALKLLQARFPAITFKATDGVITADKNDNMNLMLNDAGDAWVKSTPGIAGVQTALKADESGNCNVRLVGTLQGYTRYEEIGFEVTVNGKVLSKSCTKVYTSILAADKTETAESKGAAYLYTLVLKNLNTELSGQVTVRGYAVLESGEKIFTQSVCLTYLAGSGEWDLTAVTV